jgi:hypothetical protein
MGPTTNVGTAPDGRRCPRPTRPVTAFGGLSPPVAGPPGFARGPTGCCRRRRLAGLRTVSREGGALVHKPRPAGVGLSPTLPLRTGVSRTFTGVPSDSRTPLTRGPVLGLRPPPPRRRCSGPVRFSFGTWAFTPFRVCRRRPPSRLISGCSDPKRDVRVRPRPQWGSTTNVWVGIITHTLRQFFLVPVVAVSNLLQKEVSTVAPVRRAFLEGLIEHTHG